MTGTDSIIKSIFVFIVFLLTTSAVEASVVINEFLPNPSGPSSEDTEWIELYSNDSVDLSGWQLGDSVSLYTIASGSSIAASGFLVFEKSTTNIALNNSGDTVRLLNAQGSVVDNHTYGSTDEDVSIGRTSNGSGSWVTCTTPTKGSDNNCSEPAPSPTNTPTKTPTQAPQSTSTPTRPPSSTPTKKLTPTKTPTPKKSPTPEASPSGLVLGAETPATMAATVSGGLRQMLPLIIALLFVAIGLAIIAGVLIWKKRKLIT